MHFINKIKFLLLKKVNYKKVLTYPLLERKML